MTASLTLAWLNSLTIPRPYIEASNTCRRLAVVVQKGRQCLGAAMAKGPAPARATGLWKDCFGGVCGRRMWSQSTPSLRK